MTEQEIVNAIKSYAGEHGCTFSEYGNSIIEPKEGISATFRVHWNGSTVDKFYIHNSPESVKLAQKKPRYPLCRKNFGYF